MRYRTLPRTDISVSEVGFGVWTLATGWWGEKDDREAVDLLRAALDRGITLFDTADSYGNGRGETLLAQAFEGRRDEVRGACEGVPRCCLQEGSKRVIPASCRCLVSRS